MAIQMFNLGPPAVDTFSMIGNLGKSFFDAYDAQRRRAAEDRERQLKEEAIKLNRDMVTGLGGADTPAPAQGAAVAPGLTPTSETKLPTFAQGDLPYRSAIKAVESRGSGDYAAIGPRHPRYGRALGAYQVMEANLPQWSMEALGRRVSPDEFMRSPEIQDRIFDHKFGQYVAKYGNPQDAASVWFSGKPLAGNNRKDVLGTSVPEYVRRFNSALGQGGGGPRRQVASAAPGAGFTPDTSGIVGAPRNFPAVNAAIPSPGFSPPNNPTVNAAIQSPARPIPFDEAVPGANAFGAIGGINGTPTMPLPSFTGPTPAPAAPGAPQAAPAPPQAPAPVQVAQAAPAAPVASDATATGDPIAAVFRRLPPAQQQWYRRALSNPYTAPAAMQRLQSMVKQDNVQIITDGEGRTWMFNQATRQFTPAPIPPKRQTQWSWVTRPDGTMVGTNQADNDVKILNPADTTGMIKEYNFALQRGENPGSFTDFLSTRAKAMKAETNVNVNSGKAETKFDETVATEQAKMFSEMLKDGVNARSDLGRIRRLRAALSKLPGGIEGGIQAFASRYGIKVGPNASEVEVAQAIINQLVPQQRPPGSGTMSDRDVELFQASLPQLMNTPKGNRLILDTMESVAVYRQRQGEIAGRLNMNKITRQQAIEELQKLPDPFERFNAAIEQDESLLTGAGGAGTGGGKASPGLQPGQTSVAPGGWKVERIE